MQVAAMAPQTSEELIAQPYIRDDSQTVGDLVNEAIQKFGERVEVSDFARISTR
jgi:translation elongation factor EF-Ts